MTEPTANSFSLLSAWSLPVPPERVWALLVEPEDWPRWWPQVRRVEQIARGDRAGVGAAHRTRWGSRLPYGLVIETRVVLAERPRLLELDAWGDVAGRGRWTLDPWGQGTRVHYRWEVRLTRPWMRRLAPLLHPLFAWNHHQVMKAGAKGMARALGCPPPRYRIPTDASAQPLGPAPGAPSTRTALGSTLSPE